jgi:hypothetical protein
VDCAESHLDMMHEIRGLRDAGPRRVSVPS